MLAKYIRREISIIFCLNFRVFRGLQPLPEQLPDSDKTEGLKTS
jgi:hypothetical protein